MHKSHVTALVVLLAASLAWLVYWGIELRPLLLALPVINPDPRYYLQCVNNVARGEGAVVGVGAAVLVSALLPIEYAWRPSRRWLVLAAVAVVASMGVFEVWLRLAS